MLAQPRSATEPFQQRVEEQAETDEAAQIYPKIQVDNRAAATAVAIQLLMGAPL